jgi:hypothetical protein
MKIQLFNPSIILLCLMTILSTATNAQVKTQNNNIWVHYVGKVNFNKKLSFTIEATKRNTEWVQKPQQWFVRPSIDYNINKLFTAGIGYTYYETFSYGTPAIFKSLIEEDHIWMQLNGKFSIKSSTLQTRLRDENRFIGTDRIYRNRLRFMALYTHPIIKKQDAPLLSFVVGDEVFFNVGSYSGKSLMNQNRIIAGFAYNFNKDNQIQINYIHQNIWNYSNTILESNPTIRFSYFQTININKYEPSKK